MQWPGALFMLLALAGCKRADVSEASAEPPLNPSTFATTLPHELNPSKLLLLSRERLNALRRPEARADRAVAAVLENASQHLDDADSSRSSPENMAFAYVITGEKKYCKTALRWCRASMKDDLRQGSYLYFGDHMRPVSLTLNWCAGMLSEADAKPLADYLVRWTHELWFDNQGSGWGLSDPGNNYHYAFLEGTAFAGYALAARGNPEGSRYVNLVIDRLERKGGALTYLRERLPGGGWAEGVNYGQRAKQRMFNALSLIASMGGKNYFREAPFFANSIYYALYQTQPGWRLQHPMGDLARSVTSPVGPYDRHYVQIAVRWIEDGKARGIGQWYLNHVAPSFRAEDFDWQGGYFLDPIHAVAVKPIEPVSLAKHYLERGDGFVHARSSWRDDATSVTLSAPSIIDQSHAHFDAGAFVLYRGGWLVVDAASYSHSGLLWQPGAHSGIDVVGAERRFGAPLDGLTRHHADESLLYAQVDATGQFLRRDGDDNERLLEECTRELVFIMPDHVITYDRVRPRSGRAVSWRAHFPAAPQEQSGRYLYTNRQATVALELLAGGAARIESDRDLESDAYRVVVTPADERVLAAFVTALGSKPPKVRARRLPSEGDVVAALVNDAVIVFSQRDKGVPADLPFRYTLPRGTPRKHTLVNMQGGINLRLIEQGNSRTVVVEQGGELLANGSGLIRFVR